MIPVSITSKWQMTIPKAMRKAIGLRRPGRAVVTMEPKRKAFTIEQPVAIFDFAEKYKPRKNKGVSVLKAREYMERHYERT